MHNVSFSLVKTVDELKAGIHVLLEPVESLCVNEDSVIKNWELAREQHYKQFYVLKDGLVIGCFGCQIILNPTYPGNGFEINNVYLLENYRKKGIGKSIMSFCHDFAKQHDCWFCRLFVFPENKAAINLYKDIGYKHTSNYYWKELKDH
jgi:ribosomal protein S18 acetylase RimI-like enzyme